MKREHMYLCCVGIIVLFGAAWAIYFRALYVSTIEQIGRSKRKLKVFVNYAIATCENEQQHTFRLQNLEFFLQHGVAFSETASITYGITVSGDFSAYLLARKYSERARQLGLPNIFILSRENEGYDFGAHAAMLDAQCEQMGLKANCDLPYDAFIFMNDGVRGPFLPSYMPKYYHWSQAFLDKLTALQYPSITRLPDTTDSLSSNVALVGTSIACLSKDDVAVQRDKSYFGPKVEGFAFAITGEALAHVRKETNVFSSHPDKASVIISGEYNLSRTVLQSPRKWGVSSLLKQHEGIDFRDQRNWDCNSYVHPSRKGSYGLGGDIAPLEVIFHKARWHNGDHVSENIMTMYSGWQDRKSAVQNHMANEVPPTANSRASTLVSYVYGGCVIEAKVETPRFLNGDNRVDVCDANLDMFLKRGYSPNADVDFVFTVLQGRQIPKKLKELARVSANVFIHKATWDCGLDLCQHQSVVEKTKGMKSYSEFIFLNCEARGPYGSVPGHPIWYRQAREALETYDAIGPTISSEIEYHLQTYMIAVSGRSIHTIDALWHKNDLSDELVRTKLNQLNISAKHLDTIGQFLKAGSSERVRRTALGELGLSLVLLSNGKKLRAACFDPRTLGIAPGAGEGTTACIKDKVAPKCLNPKATDVSQKDCLECPPLEPNHCMFVKFGGDVALDNLISPWTYARVSEYDSRDLGYSLSIAKS